MTTKEPKKVTIADGRCRNIMKDSLAWKTIRCLVVLKKRKMVRTIIYIQTDLRFIPLLTHVCKICRRTVYQHVAQYCNPVSSRKNGRKQAPFTNLTEEEVNTIDRAMKQTDRYRIMKEAGCFGSGNKERRLILNTKCPYFLTRGRIPL